MALIVHAFPKLSETFIVSKFLGLRKKGWDVHVVCKRSDPSEWTKFHDLNKKEALGNYVHIVKPRRPRWRVLSWAPIAVFQSAFHHPETFRRYVNGGGIVNKLQHIYLDSELISLKPDLIHFEFGPLAVGRMHVKETLKTKVIVSFRGYDLNYIGLGASGYYGEVWEKADAIHLLGQDLWRRAQKRGCPPSKNKGLIPPAIDLDYFKPERTSPKSEEGQVEPLKILSVGRLAWKKGYEYGLHAVKLLAQRGYPCKYRIIGGGDYLESVAFAKHQLGLENIVHLMGSCPQSEVKKQMQWADVFLHSSTSEGFCNAVMEAQAMQLPVVCTDADGLSENVANGKTGFVVPRRDPNALAEKLAVLANDPKLGQKMGEAGRERVRKHFRLDDQLDAFDRLYREVLNIPSA